MPLGAVPNHVGLIMDGNGRWATRRGLCRTAGHAQARYAVERAVAAALHLGVRWLTLFSFSTENWQRDPEEVAFLMRPWHWLMCAETAHLLRERGVTVTVVGDFADLRLPRAVLVWKASLEEPARTAGEHRLTVNIAFNYGGRQEILHAVNTLVSGKREQLVDARRLSDSMWLSGCPDVDLIIRTSGEQRLSNFMIWQAAYAEYVFTSTLWPDFNEEDFAAAITDFASRNRRWGGLRDAAT